MVNVTAERDDGGRPGTAFARAGSNVILVCANMEDGNAVTVWADLPRSALA